jgi:hypothetical protein
MIRPATMTTPIIAIMPKLIPMVCSILYASDGLYLCCFGENIIFFVRTRRLFDYDFFEWSFWHVVGAVGVSVVFYVAVRGEWFEDYFFFWFSECYYQ